MQSDEMIHHITRIMSVARSDHVSDVPESIARSWLRCLEHYSLEPSRSDHTWIMERSEFAEHRERLDDTLRIAQHAMNHLFRHIAGSRYAVLLTDNDGVIVNGTNESTLISSFVGAGLWLGANWHEQHEGTNAIGTCLAEKRPITVHLDEHFLSHNTGLSCSAAPIFDPYGMLLAVLDISAVGCRDAAPIQSHTQALAVFAAKLIERCHFREQFRNQWVLSFHSRPEFLGMLDEGMLALDGEGRILAANQSALDHLDGRLHVQRLIGLPLDEVFEVELETLMRHSGHKINSVWPVRDRSDTIFFASLHTPESASGIARSTVPNDAVGPLVSRLDFTLEGLKGGDSRMTYNVRCAQRLLNKGVAMLLQGETGTGKEVFAKAIHEASTRAAKPFVAVNCAAIPERLIESELFGYEHGAFTGARRQGMRGKVLQASGGTLFLDEIGDMPLHLQTRLLRVLEAQEVLPLGCERPISVDLHVISATHRDLHELVKKGEFREDLYYRLNGMALTLPALRERLDQSSLIRSIVAAEGGKEAPYIDKDAFMVLSTYSWPGNIRQLRNVLRTAVALCQDGLIRLNDLPPEIVQASREVRGESLRQTGTVTGQDMTTNTLHCAEREALIQTLASHRWNITHTADDLGISRNTLYRKMKKHGISPPAVD